LRPLYEPLTQGSGNLSGKIVIDCTNPLKPDLSGLAIGHTTSAAEQVASWAKGARVVKCFNTTSANNMANPNYGNDRPVMFLCGGDADAKSPVNKLGERCRVRDDRCR
jgi:8-hydroxy-5-deazaflavin:NADPH oxidoreductase